MGSLGDSVGFLGAMGQEWGVLGSPRRSLGLFGWPAAPSVDPLGFLGGAWGSSVTKELKTPTPMGTARCIFRSHGLLKIDVTYDECRVVHPNHINMAYIENYHFTLLTRI